MINQLRPALVLFILLSLCTGLVYPILVSGIAHNLFPVQAHGSLLSNQGHLVGSALIGQTFTSERYFHGRPSATTAPDPSDASKSVPAPYNAANSSGSNLGPTSRALIERIKADTDKLHEENPGVPIPVDLVTTSASGLDPDISPAAAIFQIPRIARARSMSEQRLRQLIAAQMQERSFGLLGEPVVNVLRLNLALDALASESLPTAPPTAHDDGTTH